MNYVQHTRIAHERLLAQSDSRPHHISLYLALFRQWNAERFPTTIQVQRREVMTAARIGSRDTYTTALRDLETWGMIGYQPSHDSTRGSRIVMTVLGGEVGPKVGQPQPAGWPESGPTEPEQVGPEVGQPVGPEVGQPTGEVAPEVGQPSLLYKTSLKTDDINVGGDAQKKIGEVFTDDGLTSAQVLDRDAEQPRPSAAPKEKVAPKRKGPREQTIRAAAQTQTQTTERPAPTRGRQRRAETTFQESAIYDHAAFAAAFAGTDYALADLRHYHELINIWRDKKTGEPPRRSDWVATAKRFMMNDATDNRLKLAPGVHAHPGTSRATEDTGIPSFGYRSSRWD